MLRLKRILIDLKKKAGSVYEEDKKKISLSKLQSSIWEKSNANSEESFSLADLDDDLIQNLIEKDISDDNNYKLK